MKYSVLHAVCAILAGISLALSLLFRSCDLLTCLAAVILPLAAVLVILLAAERKHPEWKRFDRRLGTWRLHVIKLAVLTAVFVPLTLINHRTGGRTAAGPAIIAMLMADFVFRFIISAKLGFDQLGSVEAVLAEHPGASRFFTAEKQEEL